MCCPRTWVDEVANDIAIDFEDSRCRTVDKGGRIDPCLEVPPGVHHVEVRRILEARHQTIVVGEPVVSEFDDSIPIVGGCRPDPAPARFDAFGITQIASGQKPEFRESSTSPKPTSSTYAPIANSLRSTWHSVISTPAVSEAPHRAEAAPAHRLRGVLGSRPTTGPREQPNRTVEEFRVPLLEVETESPTLRRGRPRVIRCSVHARSCRDPRTGKWPGASPGFIRKQPPERFRQLSVPTWLSRMITYLWNAIRSPLTPLVNAVK